MSKSVILTLVVTVLGLGTIAVGLYVLSQTPVPIETTALDEMPSSLVIMPQTTKPPKESDVPNAPIVRGSEPWCDEMMNKADNQWPDKDAVLFAQNCIYE